MLADEPAIIHYHGNKHTGDRSACDHWKTEYWRLRNTNRRYKQLGAGHGDRALDKYLRGVVRKDLTIVTVVNERYQAKLERNWANWMQTEGLREQRYLILTTGEVNLGFLSGQRGNDCNQIIARVHKLGSGSIEICAGPAERIQHEAYPLDRRFEALQLNSIPLELVRRHPAHQPADDDQ